MKTIKIFLASSDELKEDRMAFGNLVRRLDKIYERRGVRVELFEWEDYDAAFNAMRKQDEYNEQIKDSDLFLAMFHTLAGQYTVEEFNVATEEFRQHASPKVYVYCKDLQPGEIESQELKDFKKRLFEELGHYWCRFGNRDTMQLHFVMQLQLVESSRIESLKVEENGTVSFEGMPVANMAQLPFAAENEDYRKMSTELSELPDKIDKARQRLEKFPEDDDLKDDLQTKLNRYNYLKETFAKLQQDLLSTAKTIADLQQQQVGARLRRAIEAFEAGNLVAANTILAELAHDADKERHIENYEQQQQLAEKSLEIVHGDIEAFRLQAKTVMADVTIPIEKRIKQVIDIYAKADDWAQRSAYPKVRYAQLLFEYAYFLDDYAYYDKAELVYLRVMRLTVDIVGAAHPDTATIYSNIGGIYYKRSDYAKALEYHIKALGIRERLLGTNHPDTATSYNNIGIVYECTGDYLKAKEYHFKAMNIRERTLGPNNSYTATSYNNIGIVFFRLGDYSKALEYYFKALGIQERIMAKHHLTAVYYSNIALIYHHQDDFNKALEYYFEALNIQKQVLGTGHPETAQTYNDIGGVYYSTGDYNQALEYHFKALAIRERTLGIAHPDTAQSYNNIGGVYYCKKDYSKALEYFSKALEIREQVLGFKHPATSTSYNNIGGVYYCQGNYLKALDYFSKTLEIDECVLGTDHPDTQATLSNIEAVKKAMQQQ